MPSVRVKNSPYVNIRDVFTEDTPAAGPSNLSPVGKSPQTKAPPRPFSLPLNPHTGAQSAQEFQDIPLTAPVATSESTWTGRPRSNSRVQAHLLSTYSRRSQWSTAATNQSGSSSTDALNAQPATPATSQMQTPPAIHRGPSMVFIQGREADIEVASNGTPGILERKFSADSREQRSDRPNTELSVDEDDHHHDDIVEHLDVIDPQVGTVSKLTNAANSIMIPPLGFSRKPVIVLSAPPRNADSEKNHFDDALDRHVDDVLQRPSRVRRTLMGVWSFLKTPMGILTGIYGFLVVFWGAAIVFFLAKIINLHNDNTQGFWVEVSSQVVCALFTVTSVGFIPSRVLSTYRIYKIWKYKRLTIKRRKDAGLPQLFDMDDLPDPQYDPNFVRVLSEEEHKDLHKQQIKFAYHQTWYRPHGTETHRAFPISMALWICLMNDLNSIFQILLCGTMWGMNRFRRPAWTTGILIPAGFLAGIGAAVLIWRGGERTKRIDKVCERLRAALEAEHPPPPASSPRQTFQGSISRRRPMIPPIAEDSPSMSPQKEINPAGKIPNVRFEDEGPLPIMPQQQLPTPDIEIDEFMTIPKRP